MGREYTSWTHIAVVYENRQPKLYINGVLVKVGLTSSKTYVHPSLGYDGYPDYTSTSGFGTGMTGSHYKGLIDAIRISDTVRYDGDFTPSISLSKDAHTIGLFNFNEGSGNIANDESVNENNGVIYGATWSTDVPAKPHVVTSGATNITGVSSTLNGEVNPNGLSTTVKFDYGTTISYGKSIVVSQNSITGITNINVNANITGLIPNTTYHYRVEATNNIGTTYGVDSTFITNEQNYSLSFDGASNVVITSQVASVSNNFTMELWAKPTARDSVVLEGGNQQNTYRMAITPPHGDYNWGAGMPE